MMIVLSLRFSNSRWISEFSKPLSIAAVASSRMKIGASLTAALTSEIFCSCPPLRLFPRGPASVS